MYTENALLFPRTAIPALRGLRGTSWDALIDRVASLPDFHEETLAFMLMMIRLNGCLACETDSFRAMRGCNLCAVQTLRRFRGPDEELMSFYADALREVREFADRGTPISELIQSNADAIPTHLPMRDLSVMSRTATPATQSATRNGFVPLSTL